MLTLSLVIGMMAYSQTQYKVVHVITTEGWNTNPFFIPSYTTTSTTSNTYVPTLPSYEATYFTKSLDSNVIFKKDKVYYISSITNKTGQHKDDSLTNYHFNKAVNKFHK